jgi:hypothetical protein
VSEGQRVNHTKSEEAEQLTGTDVEVGMADSETCAMLMVEEIALCSNS